MNLQGDFYVPIYNCRVHIIIAKKLRKTLDELCKKLGKKKKGNKSCAAMFLSDDSDSTYYLVFEKGNVTSNLVNHEKAHLGEDILMDRGIKPKGETRCYLDGFLSEEIDKIFKQKKIKVTTD